MPGTRDTPAPRAGVTFELDALRREGGELVVEGHWHGVRGLRFVRPALLVGGREVLATLEHKPWAPTADPWRAAFPWGGGDVDPGDVALAVAPSVVVALEAGGRIPQQPPAPPSRVLRPEALEAHETEEERRPLAPVVEEPEAAVVGEPAVAVVAGPGSSPPAGAAERTRAPGTPAFADAPAPAPLSAPAAEHQPAPPAAMAARDRQRADADARRALAAAERRSARLAEQLEEAVRDRDAALRTRERMAAERDQAVEARTALEAERDDGLKQVARVRAQRDEALVAYRALQRRVDGLLVHGDPAPEDTSAPASLPPPASADEPIGVRAVPAAASLAPDLHRAEAPRRSPVATRLDLWAIRVLGTITAICFIVLLVLLLSVFV